MSVDAPLKYLNNYAEAEIQRLSKFPDITYQHVLVIPAYKESSEFLKQYAALFNDLKLLLVLVVNQPVSDTDPSTQESLCENIDSHPLIWEEEHLSLYKQSASTDILLVKRFANNLCIPDKFGVGLARKIGADLAVALMHKKHIQTPWIAFTDADAQLPENYFDVISEQASNIDVLTFDYQHQGSDKHIQQATQLYEAGLKYYQVGLEWAGSRYAFHAIGSCIAINKHAYTVHRGMPKRPAGEDFYLLNKIAKRGVIKHLMDCQVKIDSRISERTPFGTGTAVNEILSNDNLTYDYYHPDCFKQVKSILSQLSLMSTQAPYSDWLESLTKAHRPILDDLGLQKYHAHHSKQGFSQDQLSDDIHCWFDGLKTLQFIHLLRDQHLPNIPIVAAIEQAPFCHTNN